VSSLDIEVPWSDFGDAPKPAPAPESGAERGGLPGLTCTRGNRRLSISSVALL